MREDDGEVFWDLVGIYGVERTTLDQVNMTLDDLLLRVDTLERKRADE